MVTQSYVDKCIIDEISWFVVNLPILQDELQAQDVPIKVEEPEEHYEVFNNNEKMPKKIPAPSNNSFNKRKTLYKPSIIVNTTTINGTNGTNGSQKFTTQHHITASKLLQQSNFLLLYANNL